MPYPPLRSCSRWTLFGLVLCTANLAAPAPSTVNGQERTFASLLPESTVAYVEFTSAEQWLTHPLRGKLQRSEAFLKIWRSPEVLEMRGAQTLIELALGDSVENIAVKLTAGGMVLAFDPESQGAVLLARTKDREWLSVYLQRLVKLARDDATGKGNPDPIEQGDYRGLTVYKIDKALLTTLDDVLLITNQKALGQAIVDSYLNGSTTSAAATGAAADTTTDNNSAAPWGLAASERFQSVLQSRQTTTRTASTESATASTAQEIAWAYVDVAAVRDAGAAQELLGGRAKDFGAELILGGVLANLHRTPSLVAALELKEQSIALEVSAPHDAAWVGEEREFFVGPAGMGQALPVLVTDDTLASLSAYRDMSQMWLRAGDLFDEQVNDQLAQADSTLTTLFSGRDFGEDILGALQPELRIVVARQVFAAEQPMPSIRLPSFALVGQLRNPELMRGELKRIFQSLIGFLNIIGAMEGQPQLDLNMESSGSMQLLTASYVREVDRQVAEGAPIQFNFSPSVAFVDDAVIVSSTTALARNLAEQMPTKAASGSLPAVSVKAPVSPADPTVEERNINTLLEIDGAALFQTLVDNREQLVAQNMLEEGHSKDEAEGEVDTLLSILTLFKAARLELGFGSRAELNVHLEFASE